ncbi:MAG: hypothetical protein LBB62_04790 [Proteiniphilum sp.]|jgi:Spy/CpxP family protein refolding chaperone|nr:hypothetical protein [Proteiniphilum sp.]
MKKIVFMTLVAIFTLSCTLGAQENGRNGRNGGDRTGMRWTAKDRAEEITKQLKLTDKEKAQVEALFEQQDAKQAEQIAQQRANGREQVQDRAKRREEMQALFEKEVEKNDAELEKVIGKEKTKQWKQYRADRQKEMRDSNRAGRQGPR